MARRAPTCTCIISFPARRRFVGYVFVWFKIAKLNDAITLAVIGVFVQLKNFFDWHEEEKRMIEKLKIKIEMAIPDFTSWSMRFFYISPQQLWTSRCPPHIISAITTTINHYNLPLQFPGTTYLCNSPLQLTTAIPCYNLPLLFSATTYFCHSPLQLAAAIHR